MQEKLTHWTLRVKERQCGNTEISEWRRGAISSMKEFSMIVPGSVEGCSQKTADDRQ